MCTARGALPTIVFPSGKTFLLKPIAVSGPCTSPHVHVQVSGNLVGPSTIAEWQDATEWLRFTHVEGLTVDGPGLIGGQGPMWWPCRTKPHVTCQKPAPTALYFGYCNDLRLDGLHLHNNPRNHISLLGCNGGVVSNLVITAPGDSPNTDGIDIQDTKDLQINNSTIATGDDCIAILNNTCNVNISYVICGPGHGISIGSLGKEGGLAMVEQIHLFHCTFKDTTNGARIKTWETGTGYVRDISYQDLIMDRVQNPIFIDQNYNPNPNPTSIASQIKVSGVQFNGVRGTSSEQQAVKVECSPAAPCTNVVLKDVSMAPATPGENLTSVLFNAQGQACCNCNPPVFC
ncbi:hypothetical protein MRB53_011852 [Persea americana]|uniref:Uncharacterized protein n=1 Tax=Persea americana TaxID=3435 RepID=A0ACC2LW14_PERAE|nr:hypothetical protein MRB53_011852 [Persea americana]